MRVTLLGTGASAGVPMIGGADGRGDWGVCDPAEPRNRRSRSSIVVERAGGALLVDTGPELRQQLISCAISRIDAVLYTHTHADHITGLDDARLLNRIAGRPLDSFGTAAALEELATRFPYAFRPWRPPGFYRPVLVPRVIAAGDTVAAPCGDVRIFEQDHGFTTTLGLRIGAFGYSTDVFDLDEAAFAALAGVETWVVGCFQRPPHRTHAPLDKVLGWVARLRPRRTVLTHMGTDMDWAWMRDNLPHGVEAGYDGQVLEMAG
ncbi:MAG TPA: MBL fold metallo-hydrolase [Acetobacteraceae bacterium]|nr:MBL fold metallo-hydrolase [Acetobacteraceae bacterium]